MLLLLAGPHRTHPKSHNESVAETRTEVKSIEIEMKSTASGRSWRGSGRPIEV